MLQVLAHFAVLEDPRAANARHELSEIMFIAIAATLAGAKTCVEMAEFGEAKETLLRKVLELPHGIPSHDTFSTVFRALDPAVFAEIFARFATAFGTAIGQDDVVAVDGKARNRWKLWAMAPVSLFMVAHCGRCKRPGRHRARAPHRLGDRGVPLTHDGTWGILHPGIGVTRWMTGRSWIGLVSATPPVGDVEPMALGPSPLVASWGHHGTLIRRVIRCRVHPSLDAALSAPTDIGPGQRAGAFPCAAPAQLPADARGCGASQANH